MTFWIFVRDVVTHDQFHSVFESSLLFVKSFHPVLGRTHVCSLFFMLYIVYDTHLQTKQEFHNNYSKNSKEIKVSLTIEIKTLERSGSSRMLYKKRCSHRKTHKVSFNKFAGLSPAILLKETLPHRCFDVLL